MTTSEKTISDFMYTAPYHDSIQRVVVGQDGIVSITRDNYLGEKGIEVIFADNKTSWVSTPTIVAIIYDLVTK